METTGKGLFDDVLQTFVLIKLVQKDVQVWALFLTQCSTSYHICSFNVETLFLS